MPDPTEKELREVAYAHRDEVIAGSGVPIEPKELGEPPEEPTVKMLSSHEDTFFGFKNVFTGKAPVRATQVPDGRLIIEAWLPDAKGHQGGWLYTGAIQVDHPTFHPRTIPNETQDPVSDSS